MYSENLFYSKLDFDAFEEKNKIKQKDLINNLFITHFYYLSYPSDGDFNINFSQMDTLLKKMNSSTYYLDYDILKKKIIKNFVSKDENIFVKKGGLGTAQIMEKYNKIKDYVKDIKLYDNHKDLKSRWIPKYISVNEMNFAIILNYLSISPPIILQDQAIINEINKLYKKFIITNKKIETRSEYVKLNLKIKKKFYELTNNLLEQKYPIKEQILYNGKFDKKINYGKIEKVLFLYNVKSKMKPYIFIIDEDLFLTMRGTQTFEQVFQDIYSVKSSKISYIIEQYMKNNVITANYSKILNIIKDEYGEYVYSYSFFEAVLYILEYIVNYLVSNRKYYNNIYIIGHSLGAVESTVIAIILLALRKSKGYSEMFKSIKLITFGEPSGLSDTKESHEFIKKINNEMGDTFSYVRCVSYFEDDTGYMNKDIVVVGNPVNTLFFDKIYP